MFPPGVKGVDLHSDGTLHQLTLAYAFNAPAPAPALPAIAPPAPALPAPALPAPALPAPPAPAQHAPAQHAPAQHAPALALQHAPALALQHAPALALQHAPARKTKKQRQQQEQPPSAPPAAPSSTSTDKQQKAAISNMHLVVSKYWPQRKDGRFYLPKAAFQDYNAIVVSSLPTPSGRAPRPADAEWEGAAACRR